MNQFIRHYNLKPGDEIVIPKSGWNIVQHHAVYLGFDHQGTDWIIENQVNAGVRLITADAFFASVSQVNRIIPFHGSNAERKELVKKALRSVGKPYDLINYNCQHFTSELRTGKRESYQLQNAAAVFIGVLLVGALLSE